MSLVDLIYNFVGVRVDYSSLYIYSEDYHKYAFICKNLLQYFQTCDPDKALCVVGVSWCAMFCRGRLGSATECGQAPTDLLLEWKGTGPPG